MMVFVAVPAKSEAEADQRLAGRVLEIETGNGLLFARWKSVLVRDLPAGSWWTLGFFTIDGEDMLEFCGRACLRRSSWKAGLASGRGATPRADRGRIRERPPAPSA